MNIQEFAELVETQQLERLIKDHPGMPQPEFYCKTTIKPGKKYIKVDVGSSGKFMVDEHGNIWGIKAYGVIHKGHHYGTLDTINNYYWGDYHPQKIS
ncbi:MAG TPA: hypothetical protein ENH82_17470 [bacterium]|nr:hypothetical protein [bacterium]